MVVNFFYVSGIIGLILIISGVLIKNRNRRTRDIIYINGGVALAAYSFYIKDIIFIILQIIFILVAIYDLIKLSKNKIHKK
ncbi:MAG: hypothetical protein WD876_02935 [Candidatus Pacearchaeota archaeon]